MCFGAELKSLRARLVPLQLSIALVRFDGSVCNGEDEEDSECDEKEEILIDTNGSFPAEVNLICSRKILNIAQVPIAHCSLLVYNMTNKYISKQMFLNNNFSNYRHFEKVTLVSSDISDLFRDFIESQILDLIFEIECV